MIFLFAIALMVTYFFYEFIINRFFHMYTSQYEGLLTIFVTATIGKQLKLGDNLQKFEHKPFKYKS